MESTGAYWKPVWNLLDRHVKLILANAHHVRALPGEKTDNKDGKRLAALVRPGYPHLMSNMVEGVLSKYSFARINGCSTSVSIMLFPIIVFSMPPSRRPRRIVPLFSAVFGLEQ